MSFLFDPFNMLLLGIALIVLWRLRTMLGARTGNERPPFDPYAAKRTETTRAPEAANTGPPRLPQGAREEEAARPTAEPPPPVWTHYATEGSPLALAIEKLVAADSSFAPKAFLDGAKLAYEMIIEAFAKGDKQSLKPLLSRDVMTGFAGAIDARAAAGQTVEQRFVGIDKADLAAADLTGNRAQVTVRFVSQIISATLARDGSVIDGDRTQIRDVTDQWTFERDITARDPNWKLVATNAAT
jgi:predicted lipid-binding transport protein (Tim44 family)